MLWHWEHTIRLCQPVASHVVHFCHAFLVRALANFPVQGLLARARPHGWSITSAENENAAQRVQTATGCSRCWRDCKRERVPRRPRIICGVAVLCFNVSRKKLACMADSHHLKRKKGRSRSLHESERPNHRLSAGSDYSSTSSLLSLPPPTFAPTPTAARILASISCAMSGLSLRNLRVLSLPWPIFSPL